MKRVSIDKIDSLLDPPTKTTIARWIEICVEFSVAFTRRNLPFFKATIKTLLDRLLKPSIRFLIFAKSLYLFSLILLQLKKEKRRNKREREREKFRRKGTINKGVDTIETGNGGFVRVSKTRRRGNTGPARVTELHLTQFPPCIAIIAKPRFRSKPANDDRGICVLYTFWLFCRRHALQIVARNHAAGIIIHFFEDRSREFIPLFFSLSLSLLLLPFLFLISLCFSFVSNVAGEESRSILSSISFSFDHPCFISSSSFWKRREEYSIWSNLEYFFLFSLFFRVYYSRQNF